MIKKWKHQNFKDNKMNYMLKNSMKISKNKFKKNKSEIKKDCCFINKQSKIKEMIWKLSNDKDKKKSENSREN